MKTTKQRSRVHLVVFVMGCILILAAGSIQRAQQRQRQAVDSNGAPLFKVDPFWPKPLPNRWGMQQVTGIFVDQNDHIWFLNRAAKADPDEVGGENNRIDCCIRGPELIELDQEGNVAHAWGGPGYHPLWPTALQTVLVDRQGFVWVAGTAAQDSILKFTKDGKLVWDFDHRPPKGSPPLKENNQQTDVLVSKGRFNLDEDAREIYIINWKRVLVYDMDTGAFKRGWGGHGMPLSEITNDPIPGYKWTGGPPPEEKNFVPDLHFVEFSKEGPRLRRRAWTEPDRGIHETGEVCEGILCVAQYPVPGRDLRRTVSREIPSLRNHLQTGVLSRFPAEVRLRGRRYE